MTKVLVTGGKGQLGSELKKLAVEFPETEMTLIDKEDLDLTDLLRVKDFFKNNSFDYVINCAAYTAVDNAEEDADLAYLLNKDLPELLAQICHESQMVLIHISTDYVFCGKGYAPLNEESAVQPNSIYGKSKLMGEQGIQKILEKHLIFRTSWLYSSHGNNFVKTILRLAEEKDELNIVSDQIGTPTYAADLAHAILSLIAQKCEKFGLYHFSNEGVASWYDFAHFFVSHKRIDCQINPIMTSEYKTKAVRPPFSVMSKEKLKRELNIFPRHWSSALIDALELI